MKNITRHEWWIPAIGNLLVLSLPMFRRNKITRPYAKARKIGPTRFTRIFPTVFQQRHRPSVRHKLFVQISGPDVANRPASHRSFDLAHGAANSTVQDLLRKCRSRSVTATPYLPMRNTGLVQLRCIYSKKADRLPIYFERIAI